MSLRRCSPRSPSAAPLRGSAGSSSRSPSSPSPRCSRRSRSRMRGPHFSASCRSEEPASSSSTSCPPVPQTPPELELTLGERVSLAEARQRTPFELLELEDEPDAVYLGERGTVWFLVWKPGRRAAAGRTDAARRDRRAVRPQEARGGGYDRRARRRARRAGVLPERRAARPVARGRERLHVRGIGAARARRPRLGRRRTHGAHRRRPDEERSARPGPDLR